MFWRPLRLKPLNVADYTSAECTSWKKTCTLSLEFYFSTYFFRLWQYMLVTGSFFHLWKLHNMTQCCGDPPPATDQLNPSNPSTTPLTPQSSKTRYLVIHRFSDTFKDHVWTSNYQPSTFSSSTIIKTTRQQGKWL